MYAKACSVCGKAKTADGFQKRLASHDGLTAACKECLHERDRKRYPKEAERRGLWYKLYSTGHGRAEAVAARARWDARNADKKAARGILARALKAGRIKRQPCEVCGSDERIHGHHDDYALPLQVKWLCAAHHRLLHKTAKP